MAETEQNQEEQSQGQGDQPNSSIPTPPPAQWDKFVAVVKARKVDFAQWVTRLMTIGFGFLYLVPIFGHASNFYYKAFMAAAATSALRLHQRLPPPSFTQLFFAQLMLEDSCHYLFYSLIFIYSQPITLAILPIGLFAILHFASFSLNLLDALGRNQVWIGRLFISIVEFQTVTILRMAAAAEILLMLFATIYTFAGKASLITPFVYYRFLTLRYASRRNHYTRTMFSEIRVKMEHVSNSPRCPAAVGNIIRKVIGLVSRLAPPTVPAPSN